MSEQQTRIITMQQLPMVFDARGEVALDDIVLMSKNQQARAEAELSQAFADGYEIADVTQTVGERVIVTTWTLKPALTTLSDAIDLAMSRSRPTPSFDTVR